MAKKTYPLSEQFKRMFDGSDLTACIEAIDKMGWCIEYKYELVKKLTQHLGSELFSLETQIHMQEKYYERHLKEKVK